MKLCSFLLVAVLWPSGAFSSRNFTGGAGTDNDHVAHATAIDALAPISEAAWIYFTSLDVTVRRVISKGTAAGNGGLDVAIQDNGGFILQIYAWRWSTTIGGWFIPVATSGWHHIAVTYAYSSTSDAPLIYLDGVSQSVSQNFTPAGTLGTDTQDLYIGNNSTLAREFNGNIAEVAIWNVILKQNQITSLAKGTPPNKIGTKPVFYKPYHGVASPEPDFSGNRLNGTLTGTTKARHCPCGK